MTDPNTLDGQKIHEELIQFGEQLAIKSEKKIELNDQIEAKRIDRDKIEIETRQRYTEALTGSMSETKYERILKENCFFIDIAIRGLKAQKYKAEAQYNDLDKQHNIHKKLYFP